MKKATKKFLAVIIMIALLLVFKPTAEWFAENYDKTLWHLLGSLSFVTSWLFVLLKVVAYLKGMSTVKELVVYLAPQE